MHLLTPYPLLGLGRLDLLETNSFHFAIAPSAALFSLCCTYIQTCDAEVTSPILH